jgi:broad specificity phosphatase PhoE
MTIRLSLISHASTEAVRAARFARDESLDRFGVTAAQAMGHTLRPYDLSRTAPERRTTETAEALGLAASRSDLIRDWDCGRWAGLSFEEIQEQEPSALGEWLGDPSAAPHGGESLLELLARVSGWLEGLQAGAIVAVTHPAVIRAAIVSALGVSPAAFWRIDIAPLSCVDLTGHNGRWNLGEIRRYGKGELPTGDGL